MGRGWVVVRKKGVLPPPFLRSVCEALQLCCWPKPKNRKEWIPHQNSKEHTKSLREREREGREMEKGKRWKPEKSELGKSEIGKCVCVCVRARLHIG
jgi:hypothetical protein